MVCDDSLFCNGVGAGLDDFGRLDDAQTWRHRLQRRRPLLAQYVLPAGSLQAVRANLRYNGSQSSCRSPSAENPQPHRRFPWGGQIDAEHANYWHETAIGTTSAVGCFPRGRSPYGCEEMSGSAWEWTRSQRGDYPYPKTPEDRAERERFEKSAAGFVLRGGGFGGGGDYVRCAARLDFGPAYGGGFVGIPPSG